MKFRLLLLTALGLLTVKSQAQVDYTSQIQPIFTSNCVSCHRGASGVNLSYYETVMASVGSQYQKNIVIPGDAANSPLYEKLNPSPTHGNRMPSPNGLAANSIELIKTWINEGAKAVATSIETDEKRLTFELFGNYPNPFNPSTTIQFQVPTTSEVNFTIYSTSGQLVQQFTQIFSSGQHEIQVNLAGQSTGLYLYRMQSMSANAQVFTATGKMMLIK